MGHFFWPKNAEKQNFCKTIHLIFPKLYVITNTDNGLKVIFLALQDNLFLGTKLAGVSLAQNLVIRFF